MSVEQRHRDAARKWLVKRERTSEYTIDSLARLLADTERAALDRAADQFRMLVCAPDELPEVHHLLVESWCVGVLDRVKGSHPRAGRRTDDGGPDVTARETARHSCYDQMAWRAGAARHEGRVTEKNVKAALLAVGTQGRFVVYERRTAIPHSISWSVGIAYWRNLRAGYYA